MMNRDTFPTGSGAECPGVDPKTERAYGWTEEWESNWELLKGEDQKDERFKVDGE